MATWKFDECRQSAVVARQIDSYGGPRRTDIGSALAELLLSEGMRLREGIWLPRVNRVNGADYPTLFDGITTDSTSIYSNYIRFSTDVKDVKLAPPNQP